MNRSILQDQMLRSILLHRRRSEILGLFQSYGCARFVGCRLSRPFTVSCATHLLSRVCSAMHSHSPPHNFSHTSDQTGIHLAVTVDQNTLSRHNPILDVSITCQRCRNCSSPSSTTDSAGTWQDFVFVILICTAQLLASDILTLDIVV